jgi:metal-sulfur cluster biosynthetic enzyme
MTTVAEVLGALEGVRDPELDQSLVELGFVAGVEVEAAGVAVRLRLPTYFCAPNFAFLMAVDARRAVATLPGVGSVRVVLEDHFTADEITDAVDRGGGFVDAFPGDAQDELGELRTLFRRKALTAREGRLGNRLLAAGYGAEDIAALRLRELPAGPDADRCRELRRDLGLDAGPEAPAFVRGDGEEVTGPELLRFLRLARLVAVSLEGNAGLCRGLLKTRYELPEEEAA